MAQVRLEGSLHLLKVRGQVLLLEGDLNGTLDASFPGHLVLGGKVVHGLGHGLVLDEQVLVPQACSYAVVVVVVVEGEREEGMSCWAWKE